MGAPLVNANWANQSHLDGFNLRPNKVQPTDEKRAKGFTYPEKPSRSELNWWMNNVGQWIAYLNTTITDAGINQNFPYDAGSTSGLNFGIGEGKVFLGSDDPLEVSAQTVAVTNNATSYVYLDLTQSGTPNDMPSSAASWPAVDYIPLYEVVAASGSITSFVDFRTWAIQGGAGTNGVYPEYELKANVSGTVHNLSTLAGLDSEENTWVFVDGVKLNDTEYNVTGTSQVTLTSTITNQDLEVVKLVTVGSVLAEVEQQTATEGQTLFTLAQLPDNKFLSVYINGIYQGANFTRIGTTQIQLDAQDLGAIVQFVRNGNAGDFAGVPGDGDVGDVLRKTGAGAKDYEWQEPDYYNKTEIEASDSEMNAGVSSTKFSSPRRLRAGFAVSLAQNGYISFPTWLGGVIFQWGRVSGVTNGTYKTFTFPIPFPTACYVVVTTPIGTDNGGGSTDFWGVNTPTTTSVRVYTDYDDTYTAMLFAVGS